MIYFETSCKTGENVNDLFEQIASDLVRQHDPKIVRNYFCKTILNQLSFFLA
jgi:GTPase SAR1 family protein